MSEVVRICGRSEIDSGTARRFDVGAYRIAVVRIDDDVYAIDDTCSHEDYSLSEGEVLTEECEIECWKHGSTFDLRTGEPQTLPATRPVPVYVVHLEGDDVMVELP
jgi:3-phenylpropionate/trans-cinnamate dioxygenase ferredoxin subunit